MFGKDKKEEFKEKILYETQPNIFVYSKGILISMFVLGFLFFLYSAGISYIGNGSLFCNSSFCPDNDCIPIHHFKAFNLDFN